MLMKIPNSTIENRTHDLPVCSAVPQPTATCLPQDSLYAQAISAHLLWATIHTSAHKPKNVCGEYCLNINIPQGQLPKFLL